MRLSRTIIQIERILLLLLIGLLLTVNAAPRRGHITTCLFADTLDFSAIDDSCQKRINSISSCKFNKCIVAEPDFRTTQRYAYSANGILDLGRCIDTGCIDTLKNVPTSGYLDSVDFSYTQLGHLFAIRTSEMNYALLYYRGMGSGLPFNDFKWAYQPDGTPNFSEPNASDARSGFGTLIQPSSDTGAFSVDFSSLTPICASMGVNNSGCIITERDCYFKFDSIIAPYGVFYDSSVSARIQSRYINGKTITLDREGVFYLDSMMKLFALHAPQDGYSGSCPARKGVYFLKTSENWYAVLIKIGEYIGGIDRTYYYWAYQPDTGAVLYKNSLFEQPDSLFLSLDVFSGMPMNPVFALNDSAGIAEITRQIYLSVNTLLDPSIKRADTAQWKAYLGYGMLTVAGMFDPESALSSYIPYMDIHGGLINYYKVAPSSSAMPPQLLYDKDSRLEKTIIRVCCQNNLMSADGNVRFCDLVADSLKPRVPVLYEEIRSGQRNAFVALKAVPKGIRYQVSEAGRVRMELFDLRGRCVSVLIDGFRGAETYFVDLHDKQYTPGVYLLTCSRPGTTNGNVVFPLVFK